MHMKMMMCGVFFHYNKVAGSEENHSVRMVNPEMHLTTRAYNLSIIQSSSKTHDVT